MQITIGKLNSQTLWTLLADIIGAVSNIFHLGSSAEQQALAIVAGLVTGAHVLGKHVGSTPSPRS
ncbi:MAG: hypothetical protein QXU98_13205 [Candidatus Parvarchaeota archaeon]